MELINDNWRHIFTYLSPTDLILLKTTHKHLYKLVSQVYGSKLSYDIRSVFYAGYYNLFVNYLYPMLGMKEDQNLAYYAGLSCSMELATWLCSHLGRSRKITSSLFMGAIRSGKLEFIYAVHEKFVHVNFHPSTEDIVRSMSKPCVKALLSTYSGRICGCAHIFRLFTNELETAIGFKVSLTIDYLDYLLSEKLLNERTLFTGLLNEDIFLTKHLISKGFMPTKSDINLAMKSDKLDFVDLYVKVNPLFHLASQYTVSSKEGWEYAQKLGMNIERKGSLTAAISKGNKKFVTYLYSQGVIFKDDFLKNIIPAVKLEMILHLDSLGYKLPTNIYERMIDTCGGTIDVDLFEYLENNGYHDPTFTPRYVFVSGEMDLVESYFKLDHEVTIQTWIEIAESDQAGKYIDLACKLGHELPENICDILIGDNIQLSFELAKSGYKVTLDGLVRIIKHGFTDFVKLVIDTVEVTKDVVITMSLDDYLDDKAEVMSLLIDNYCRHQKGK